MGVDLWVMPEISHHDEPWRPLRHSDTLYQAPREQALMAILADVTNGKGRFPTVWNEPGEIEGHKIPGFWYRPDEGDHDPIIPIAEPNGIPLDASQVWRDHVARFEKERERVICTCLTLDEILTGDWDQVVVRHGLLFEKDYLALREKNILPSRWINQVGGKATAISEEEYISGIRGENETFIQTRWQAGTVNEVSNGFLDTTRALEYMRPETSRMRFQFLFEA